MAGSYVAETKRTMRSVVLIMSMVVLMGKLQGVLAQSGCTTALLSLSPCLNYITGNQTTPSQGCCSALASTVTNNAACLCQLLGGNNSLGIPINQTRALALPAACKVTTPPVSQCQGSGAPTTSPSPTASMTPTTSPSRTPSIQTSPSSNPTKNNGVSNILASPGLVMVVTAALLAAVAM